MQTRHTGSLEPSRPTSGAGRVIACNSAPGEQEPANWGEAMHRYSRQKRMAPAIDAGNILPNRQYRDSRTGQKDKEREYDPLLHTWRAQEKEQDMDRQELNRSMKAMAIAKERALRYESHFNIINNQRKPDAPKTPPAPEPVYQEEEFTRPPREVTHRGRSYYYWPHNNTQTHLISGKHLDGEDKALAEELRAKQLAAERFSASRHYNIIQGSFYDPEEEAQFQTARRAAMASHGSAKFQRIPVGIKNRESAAYEITAPQTVRNRKLMQELEEQDAAKRMGTGLKVSYEADLKHRSDAAVALSADRALNRISHERYTCTHQRGYNIVSNQPYKGRLGRVEAPARTRPRAESSIRF